MRQGLRIASTAHLRMAAQGTQSSDSKRHALATAHQPSCRRVPSGEATTTRGFFVLGWDACVAFGVEAPNMHERAVAARWFETATSVYVPLVRMSSSAPRWNTQRWPAQARSQHQNEWMALILSLMTSTVNFCPAQSPRPCWCIFYLSITYMTTAVNSITQCICLATGRRLSSDWARRTSWPRPRPLAEVNSISREDEDEGPFCDERCLEVVRTVTCSPRILLEALHHTTERAVFDLGLPCIKALKIDFAGVQLRHRLTS
eukprot:6198405-Pleurochrysis_carterae.AAC.2